MSTRRSFFAMIGSAAVSGLVAQRASAAAPTLILPPGLITDTADFAPLTRGMPTAWPRLNAYLAAGNCPMDAIIDIKQGMSQDTFAVWLEYGLITGTVDCSVKHGWSDTRAAIGRATV